MTDAIPEPSPEAVVLAELLAKVMPWPLGSAVIGLEAVNRRGAALRTAREILGPDAIAVELMELADYIALGKMPEESPREETPE